MGVTQLFIPTPLQFVHLRHAHGFQMPTANRWFTDLHKCGDAASTFNTHPFLFVVAHHPTSVSNRSGL